MAHPSTYLHTNSGKRRTNGCNRFLLYSVTAITVIRIRVLTRVDFTDLSYSMIDAAVSNPLRHSHEW